MKEWLNLISEPLGANAFRDAGLDSDFDYPSVPKVTLQKSIDLTQYLALSITSSGAASDFAEIYRAARENYVLASLKEINKAAKDQEQSLNLKSIRYEKGTTILIEYYRRMAWIMKVLVKV